MSRTSSSIIAHVIASFPLAVPRFKPHRTMISNFHRMPTPAPVNLARLLFQHRSRDQDRDAFIEPADETSEHIVVGGEAAEAFAWDGSIFWILTARVVSRP